MHFAPQQFTNDERILSIPQPQRIISNYCVIQENKMNMHFIEIFTEIDKKSACQANQKKMSVCENPGDQKKVH